MTATDQHPVEIMLVSARPRPVDAAALAGLSAGERERAARFRRPADAARFVTGRSVARSVLGERLGVAPTAVDLVVPRPGWKPRVEDATWELSIAHAGDLVLVAVADGVEIGVDVEGGGAAGARVGADVEGGREAGAAVEPDGEASSAGAAFDESTWWTITSVAERDAAGPLAWPGHGAPDPETTDVFLRCWVRKEAILKAVRLGLSVPMAELTIRDGDPPTVVATPPHLPPPDDLALLDLDAPSGVRIALAAVTRRAVVVRDGESREVLGRVAGRH